MVWTGVGTGFVVVTGTNCDASVDTSPEIEGGAENVCISGGAAWWKSEDVENVGSVVNRARLESWSV